MFSNILNAINDIKNGKIIMVVDDKDRENEGDLIVAGEFATTENINFMATYAKGLICTPMATEVASKLELPQMVESNTDNHCTAFTVSVDHIDTTTGISAEERALTIRKLCDINSKPLDFRRPGHTFPLVAKDGGVLERRGHTEATIDIVKLAGLYPVGVCCEIMKEDGTMARFDDLLKFSKKHNLTLVSIDELVKYLTSVKSEVTTTLDTKYGLFNISGYTDNEGREHIALYMGDLTTDEPVLCRVHSQCLTGDALGSLRCDCGQQYDEAMKQIAKEKRGVLVYMSQEGRGIGLINKLKAYKLQSEGMDTVDANLALGFPDDMREYNSAANILKSLGVLNIKLMTNNPDKVKKLSNCGINIVERIPIIVKHSSIADNYMQTKQSRMGHLLDLKL